MKKQYIKPTYEVVNISSQQIMASSVILDEIEYSEEGNYSGDEAYSRSVLPGKAPWDD